MDSFYLLIKVKAFWQKLYFLHSIIHSIFIVSYIVRKTFYTLYPGCVQDQMDSFQSHQAKAINYNLMSKVCQCRLPWQQVPETLNGR